MGWSLCRGAGRSALRPGASRGGPVGPAQSPEAAARGRPSAGARRRRPALPRRGWCEAGEPWVSALPHSFLSQIEAPWEPQGRVCGLPHRTLEEAGAVGKKRQRAGGRCVVPPTAGPGRAERPTRAASRRRRPGTSGGRRGRAGRRAGAADSAAQRPPIGARRPRARGRAGARARTGAGARST